MQRLLATVDAIPRGRVASYGGVALEAGLPGRARLVGRVLRDLSARSKLAWHRVVDASGRIKTTGASAREQRRRLASEGVGFAAKNRVDSAYFTYLRPMGLAPRPAHRRDNSRKSR